MLILLLLLIIYICNSYNYCTESGWWFQTRMQRETDMGEMVVSNIAMFPHM